MRNILKNRRIADLDCGKGLVVPPSADGVDVRKPFMPQYVFRFAGREHEPMAAQCDTIDDARNEAVRHLGAYLSDHPGFADEGHWRVNVEDATGQELLHVIVATVTCKRSRD